jgi:hypothetical protein
LKRTAPLIGAMKGNFERKPPQQSLPGLPSLSGALSRFKSSLQANGLPSSFSQTRFHPPITVRIGTAQSPPAERMLKDPFAGMRRRRRWIRAPDTTHTDATSGNHVAGRLRSATRCFSVCRGRRSSRVNRTINPRRTSGDILQALTSAIGCRSAFTREGLGLYSGRRSEISIRPQLAHLLEPDLASWQARLLSSDGDSARVPDLPFQGGVEQ